MTELRCARSRKFRGKVNTSRSNGPGRLLRQTRTSTARACQHGANPIAYRLGFLPVSNFQAGQRCREYAVLFLENVLTQYLQRLGKPCLLYTSDAADDL